MLQEEEEEEEEGEWRGEEEVPGRRLHEKRMKC